MSVLGPIATPHLGTLEPTQYLGKGTTRFGTEIPLGNTAQNVSSWAISPDSHYHLIVVGARKQVVSAETGGAVALDLFEQGNFVVRTPLFTGDQGPGAYMASAVIMAKGLPNSQINLVVTSPLSAGASNVGITVFSFK